MNVTFLLLSPVGCYAEPSASWFAPLETSNQLKFIGGHNLVVNWGAGPCRYCPKPGRSSRKRQRRQKGREFI